MSKRALMWASSVEKNPHPVLLALADLADDKGVCSASIPLLRKETLMSERGVQKAIRRLEAAGMVDRQSQRRDDGGPMPNRYVLALDGFLWRK